MNIKVTGKNIEITDAIREYIEKKCERLEKFEGKNTEVTASCSVEREDQIVEIRIKTDGGFLRVEEKNNDLYASIDLAMDRAERQLRKDKEKKSGRNRNESLKEKLMGMFADENAEQKGQVTMIRSYEIKPISVEDAKLKVEESKNMFLPFMNVETNQVNVIYQRGDGTYGIVVPE